MGFGAQPPGNWCERAQRGDDPLDTLIQRADLDGLVRLVDDRTAARDWAGLRAARDRCRAAVATGRQLWPAATLAEYRLALVAPPEWAAPLIADDAGLFTIGPLTEVIAQHHSWAALSPLLPPTPGAALVAHERVLRGEEIDASTVGGLPDVFELPYALAAWEPSYALATYTDAGVEAPSPPEPASPPTRAERTGTPSDRLDDDAVELAVRQLVETWTASSNGRAEVACVEGSADDAIASLGPRAWTRRSMSLAEALAWLAWAGASGGAHGRRRGAALGSLRRPLGARLPARPHRRAGRFRSTNSATRPTSCAGRGGTPADRQPARLAAAARRRGRRERHRLGDQRRRRRVTFPVDRRTTSSVGKRT